MTTGIGYFPALAGTMTAIYFAVERGSHNRRAHFSGYGEGARLDGPAMPQSGPELERGIEVSNLLPRSPVRALQWSYERR